MQATISSSTSPSRWKAAAWPLAILLALALFPPVAAFLQYRTLPGRDDTSVMGSSMGGLISLYAIARRPDVFGRAAAVSTHWPACNGCTIDWFAAHLPDRRTHRLYLDHGTATLDAGYAPYQQRMDAALRRAGWRAGRDFVTRTFDGAEHSEVAWRARAEVPLRLLLGK